MSFREASIDEVLAGLGEPTGDDLLARCIAGLRAYPQDSYVIGGTPADQLLKQLEVKYARATSRGKSLIGDRELLLRLYDLGADLVAGVSAHGPAEHFFVYFFSQSLQPIGSVIMFESARPGSDV